MIITSNICIFYRIAGSLLACTCLLTIILTCHYFCHRYRRYKKGLPLLPLSPILIGMLISLMMVSCTGIPFVLIQCFTCQPFIIYIEICKLNAVICHVVGTFNMYMLALLSVCRYLNIVHKHSSFSRLFEHYRGYCVIFCGLISFSWSLPLLLNIGNTYKNEGIGFYCSLDWNNSAFHSRIFVYSIFICNYCLILFILIYSNLRVYFVLHYLLKSNEHFNSACIPTVLRISTINLNSSSYLIQQSSLGSNVKKHFSDRYLTRKLSRLQKLKVDQRYARITAIMVTQFIISWTPYAIVSLIIINGHIEFIRRYPLLSTISELLAKFSLILNPLILIYTSKMRRY